MLHHDGVLAAATFDNVAVGAGDPPPAEEPNPWLATDVGRPALAGSAALAGGTFTLSGAGTDIWDTADAFQYTYRPLTGDGQIVARVATLQNTNGWAKAGVMIREDLTPGSRYAALLVSASFGVAFQRRTLSGGTSTYTPGAGSAPVWVKLVRNGNVFSAYVSGDGVSWVLVGTDTVPLATTVSIGLAVTSHNDAILCTATFENVATN